MKFLFTYRIFSFAVAVITPLLISIPTTADTYAQENLVKDEFQRKKPNISDDSYDYIGCLHDGLATVSKRTEIKQDVFELIFYPLTPTSYTEKVGFVNQSGHIVIPLNYSSADNFKGGLARVNQGCFLSLKNNSYDCIGGKWGFIDTQGNSVVPLMYDDVQPFHDGLALVGNNGKFGFINQQNHAVIPLKYDVLHPFIEGIALTKLVTDTNDANTDTTVSWRFIDKQDNPVLTLESHDGFSAFKSMANLALIKQDGRYGYVNKQGEIVIKPQFQHAEEFMFIQTIKQNYFFEEEQELLIQNLANGDIIDFATVTYPQNKRLTGIAKVSQNNDTFYIDQDGNKLALNLIEEIQK